MTKYYKYKDRYSCTRYFKVKDQHSDVVQVVADHVPKKGRPFCIGITLIKYNSFIGNYGWRLDESKYIHEITAEEYNEAFNLTVKRLK